jgi:hypothetical protein
MQNSSAKWNLSFSFKLNPLVHDADLSIYPSYLLMTYFIYLVLTCQTYYLYFSDFESQHYRLLATLGHLQDPQKTTLPPCGLWSGNFSCLLD